jgi:membrane protease YdiL (CAAX protease family)
LWAALVLGALWALWHLPELISDPTLQRCRCNSLWILAQFVILAWLYNSTNAILPIVIICHAVINAADRFVLPGFANKNYQVVWSFMVGLYVLAAAIVTLVARPKRRRPAPANPGEGGGVVRSGR